jgi:hypothetical protein
MPEPRAKDAQRPGVHRELAGLPTKANIGSNDVWPDTKTAVVLLPTTGDRGHAVQPMSTTANDPC